MSAALVVNNAGPLPSAVKIASMADLRGRAPERKWIVQEWIPSGVVTGLYGDGEVGKTLLALQLQASMALGRKWLGVPVEPGKSFSASIAKTTSTNCTVDEMTSPMRWSATPPISPTRFFGRALTPTTTR